MWDHRVITQGSVSLFVIFFSPSNFNSKQAMFASFYIHAHSRCLIITSLEESQTELLTASFNKTKIISKMTRSSLGPSQPRIQWVPGFLRGGKWPGPKPDHSPSSSVKVKNEWSSVSIPPIRLYGVDRENYVCKK
jgi:hypothetical protein